MKEFKDRKKFREREIRGMLQDHYKDVLAKK